MDTFHFFGNVKAGKANAMPSYNLFNSIAKTLRILERCVSLLLLYWFLTRLSFALQISGDYFRKLSGFILNPLFVFIISNAIIATLVAKSRRFIAHSSDADNVETQLYQEFLSKSADRTKSSSEADAQSRVAEEVDYQDKQIISDMNTSARTLHDQADIDTCTVTDSGAELDSDFPKVYRRSHSENLQDESVARPTLRRSETEKYRETARSGENPRENLYPQDNLSNEEFQRTIEAFIARQMRFLREESSAIVVQNQS